uniref:RING-type E3 ubiquitin transferase n=2 Tax=Davidia involucrata TaxID=16924 RepID=A0A5B6YWA1_DAVIN
MKFGEAFMEYLHGENFLDKCSHVEYKRLKQVLKSCRTCRALKNSCSSSGQEDNRNDTLSQFCQRESCPLCDQMFFSELMKEASDISGYFSSRVRHLLHLHIATGMQRYLLRLRQCFKNDQQVILQEGRVLIDYITMNAIAMRKILKKYDKVHSSVNGRNFKSKMLAEHTEILHSPWLIELGAFYLNFNESDGGKSDELFSPFSCDLKARQPLITLMLPDSKKLEYNLTCAVCLDLVFNPYALSCGHLFCKSCACSAASVMIFQGLKAASPESKCPVCREAGVYANAVHMLELDLLLKKRCKDYWKERLITERAEMVKQSKEYWDLQTKYVIG